mmetsp:Transcript_43278/g.93295  ORF Transcript_43278/g.93295 Transcript_43278/m.93295 type:complete len:348 (-) Transcript_43278:535-1578(-)
MDNLIPALFVQGSGPTLLQLALLVLHKELMGFVAVLVLQKGSTGSRNRRVAAWPVDKHLFTLRWRCEVGISRKTHQDIDLLLQALDLRMLQCLSHSRHHFANSVPIWGQAPLGQNLGVHCEGESFESLEEARSILMSLGLSLGVFALQDLQTLLEVWAGKRVTQFNLKLHRFRDFVLDLSCAPPSLDGLDGGVVLGWGWWGHLGLGLWPGARPAGCLGLLRLRRRRLLRVVRRRGLLRKRLLGLRWLRWLEGALRMNRRGHMSSGPPWKIWWWWGWSRWRRGRWSPDMRRRMHCGTSAGAAVCSIQLRRIEACQIEAGCLGDWGGPSGCRSCNMRRRWSNLHRWCNV